MAAVELTNGPVGLAIHQEWTLVPSTTQTATGNSGAISGVTPVGKNGNHKIYVNVTAASGTTPTLVVKLQDSIDGVTFADVASGATGSLTTTGVTSLSISGPVAPYVQVVWTIGGTTPSFTFSVGDAVVSG